MLELIGLIFGGVSRLGQHWLELQDKQKERQHEATMYDKQIEMADRRAEQGMAMRQVDAAAESERGETAAIQAAIIAQAEEAKSAGGFVAQISAMVRPFLTFWHAVVIYTAVKVAMFMIGLQGGLPWQQVLISIYTDPDRALCFSMVSFWFADRSLRNRFR